MTTKDGKQARHATHAVLHRRGQGAAEERDHQDRRRQPFQLVNTFRVSFCVCVLVSLSSRLASCLAPWPRHYAPRWPQPHATAAALLLPFAPSALSCPRPYRCPCRYAPLPCSLPAGCGPCLPQRLPPATLALADLRTAMLALSTAQEASEAAEEEEHQAAAEAGRHSRR